MATIAQFRISDYYFDKIIVDYSYIVGKNLDIKFECSGKYNQAKREFKLQFEVSVFSNGNSDTPGIYLKCVGTFEFSTDVIFQDIPQYFYKNAIAILFPYVRAYISIITTQANAQKGIILPTMNLSGLESELIANSVCED